MIMRWPWVVPIGLILALLIARHCWLAAYVHPYADDFNYARAGMLHELGPRLVEERAHWNGRWASNVLVLRGPLLMGLDQGLHIYRMVPVILILLSIMAVTVLLRQLFTMRSWAAVMGGAVFVLLFIHLMPHPGQGIYWYTGAITYQLGGILIILHAAAVIALYKTGIRPVWIIVAGLTLILASGFNEVNAALLVTLHGALCIWKPRSVPRLPWWQWAMLFLALLALWYVASAPGNAVRGANFPARHDPFLTLAWAALQTGRYVARWVFDPAVLAGNMILILALRRHPSVLGALPYGRWTLTSAAVAVVFIAMVLPYWSTGLLGQYRTVNLACLFFLPLGSLAMIAWDREAFQRRKWLFMDKRPTMVACAIIMAICLGFLGNAAALNVDLFSGRARQYDQAMMQRYAAIRKAVQNGEDLVVLPVLVDPPLILDPLELRTDPAHWINAGLAGYFGSDRIQLIPLDMSR